MRIHIGDIVKHFKREIITAEQLEFDENLYMSEVDHEKYPGIECEYRFETVEEGHQCLWCGSDEVKHLNEMDLRNCETHRLKSRVVICDTCLGNMLHGACEKTIKE